MEKGYIQLYTGDGKGKTTAALGQAARALGRGMKVAVVQFMKKGEEYGEFAFLSPHLTMLQFGSGKFVDFDNPADEDCRLAEDGFSKAEEFVFSGVYDIVILDEVVTAVHFGLLQEKRLAELMRSKPENVELILTGRGAGKRIVEEADLVTEMKEVKHYYKKGVNARKGIEF